MIYLCFLLRSERGRDRLDARQSIDGIPQSTKGGGDRKVSMKTVTKTAVSWRAFGTKLDKPFRVPYTYDAFVSYEEMEAAKALLKKKSHLKAVNATRQQAKRNEALEAAYESAGYTKPNAANSSEVRLKDMFKSLLKARTQDGQPKYTRDKAAIMAEELTGETWIKRPDADVVDEEEEDDTDTDTEEEEDDDDTNGATK